MKESSLSLWCAEFLMALKQGQSDWVEQRALVIAELRRLNENIETVKLQMQSLILKDIGQLKTEMAVLQVRAGMWGLLAGALPGCITALIWWTAHK
jgi:hypothetical protein